MEIVEDPSQFKFISKANGELALRITGWLLPKKYSCALQQSDDGVVTITYADDNGNIWPAIRVDAGRIVFPKGTDFDLMMAFLSQE